MVIYKTKEQHIFGKQNYYWNEYRLEENYVEKYKCHRQKVFDGKENEWREYEEFVDSWQINDSSMPEWLRDYL